MAFDHFSAEVMEKLYTISEDNSGQRLDQWLAKNDPAISRSRWQKLIADGYVLINDQPADNKTQLSNADVVSVKLPEREYQEFDVPTVYEDDDLIVFNKPSGMLTHSKGALNNEQTVADLIAKWWKGSDSNRAGIVHRLDRVTSGLIVCAKNQSAMTHLQKQFADRKATKTYLAVVNAELDNSAYRLEWPIERNPKKPQTFRVGANGKPAVTNVKVLKRNEDASLAECQPETGRTHQIRVHLANLGAPIIGDVLYGSEVDLNGRILLHAHRLSLKMPSGKDQEFVADVPSDMQEYL